MLRLILVIPLIGHGLAHISGFVASWTNNDAGFAPRPWIFSSRVSLGSPLGKVFGLVWLAASASLTASGVGLILQQHWWVTAALLGSILSLVVILPWWNSVPPGARIGSAFDVVLLLLLATPLKETALRYLV